MNICSPNPERLNALAATLAAISGGEPNPQHDHAVDSLPPAVRDLLLASQRARPQRLLERGFEFERPTAQAALTEALSGLTE